MMMGIVWLAAVVVFVVTELMTVSLVSVWFAVGAVAGLLAAVWGWTFLNQLLAFVLVTGIALAVTRPLVRRFASKAMTHTNADRVLGGTGRVTETVDSENGAVYVDGKTWTARSEAGDVIPVEAPVRIERIEGVKLYVTRA